MTGCYSGVFLEFVMAGAALKIEFDEALAPGFFLSSFRMLNSDCFFERVLVATTGIRLFELSLIE